MEGGRDGRRGERSKVIDLLSFPLSLFHLPRLDLVGVLFVRLSYGSRNVLSYTRHMMQEFLAFRDSPIIPLRRSPD